MVDKKEWLKQEVEELIIMYHGKPELWDVTCKSYKNRAKKHSALTEMAEEFNTTIEEIQRKIHNLRNQFNSEFKKSRTTKLGQDTDELYISKWPYYNLLLFLQGSLANKSANGNLPVVPSLAKNLKESETSDNQDTWEQSEEINKFECTPILHKNNLNNNNMKRFDISNDGLPIQDPPHKFNGEEDQYDIFGKYIASQMKSLPSVYLRKKMKRKIQEVLLEISQEDELLSSPTSHSSCSELLVSSRNVAY